MMQTLTPTPSSQQVDSYQAHFEQLGRTSEATILVVPGAQSRVHARFAELGFPTLEHEDWRFTNLAPILALPFKPVLAGAKANLDSGALKPYLLWWSPRQSLGLCQRPLRARTLPDRQVIRPRCNYHQYGRCFSQRPAPHQ